MTDVASQALGAVATGSGWAPVTVCLAGVVSGIGPCAASRGVVLGAMLSTRSGAGVPATALSFASGLIVAYAAIGLAASMAAALLALSAWAYAITAIVLVLSGVRGLLDRRRCDHAQRPASAAAAFVVGAGAALTVSPCCAPLMLGVVAYATAAGDPQRGAVLLACFAAGHVAPTVTGLVAASRWKCLRFPFEAEMFVRTTAAGVSIAIGGLYGVLA